MIPEARRDRARINAEETAFTVSPLRTIDARLFDCDGSDGRANRLAYLDADAGEEEFPDSVFVAVSRQSFEVEHLAKRQPDIADQHHMKRQRSALFLAGKSFDCEHIAGDRSNLAVVQPFAGRDTEPGGGLEAQIEFVVAFEVVLIPAGAEHHHVAGSHFHALMPLYGIKVVGSVLFARIESVLALKTVYFEQHPPAHHPTHPLPPRLPPLPPPSAPPPRHPVLHPPA